MSVTCQNRCTTPELVSHWWITDRSKEKNFNILKRLVALYYGHYKIWTGGSYNIMPQTESKLLTTSLLLTFCITIDGSLSIVWPLFMGHDQLNSLLDLWIAQIYMGEHFKHVSDVCSVFIYSEK